MAFKSGGGDELNAEINVTPMVDVMLVLLIIFMITAPMMNNTGVDLQLPQVKAQNIDDPNGKLKIAHHAGFWKRDSYGNLTQKLRHICWDGCMFPNEVMMKPSTWNDILRTMIDVRNAHGWTV